MIVCLLKIISKLYAMNGVEEIKKKNQRLEVEAENDNQSFGME